ncbi:MAG: ATP12 family protein [Pseudomonadota bacterium]
MSEWAAKRFWTDVSVVAEEGAFAIKLDDRPVRTPAKRTLAVPTEAMARHIADEWQAQAEVIDPKSMPWTRSANAAIDKVAQQRDEVMEYLAGYADTDLLFYRAESPDALVERQRVQWDPVLDWIAIRYGAKFVQTAGIMPVSQSSEALMAVTGEMETMSDFQITAFHDLVTLSGSFALGLCVVEGLRDPGAIWDLSRLDETWQIEQWGEDEEAREVAELKKAAFLHATDFFRAA